MMNPCGTRRSLLPPPAADDFIRGLLTATLCSLALMAGPAAAAELDEVRARGELVWAADQEGGGPHVFPAADDPRRLTGFEVDFAALLAEELGVNVFYGGHYATETFGVKALAEHLSKRFGVPWEFIDHPTGL